MLPRAFVLILDKRLTFTLGKESNTMKVKTKDASYSCGKNGSHYRREGNNPHRIAGPAHITFDYFRGWYHKDHVGYFQKTGAGTIELNGDSYHYHIDGRYCSKEQYEDYIENQKLLL